MRVEKFDDELIAALRALGFNVADDKETAEIETRSASFIQKGAKISGCRYSFLTAICT